MKNALNSALRCNGKSMAIHQLWYRITLDIVLCVPILIMIVFTGCQKENANPQADEVQTINSRVGTVEGNVVNDYSGLSKQTMWELQQVRAATARYRNIENAIKDGYTDISVDVEHMGHHFMKMDIVDANFDMKQPELLVYNKNHEGEQELVAAEYAIPIELSPDVAPAGFSGSNDVWDRNTGFGLWLLHAWVWSYNPDGVFNPTNPTVHLH
jgi:hypothetical protein